MSIKSLSATLVKNRFGRVLKEISRTNEPLVVERAGKQVAVIMSMEAYQQLQMPWKNADRNDLLKDAFGLWAKRDDIDDNWLENGRLQWQSRWAEEDDF